MNKMNIKKVYNKNLLTEIAASGTIEIFAMNEENLKLLNFLDEDGWPKGEFLKVIKDLDTISPTEFGHNVKFFDIIDNGLKIYNKFLDGDELEIE